MPRALSAAALLPLGSDDAGHLLAVDVGTAQAARRLSARSSWRAATCGSSSNATASRQTGSSSTRCFRRSSRPRAVTPPPAEPTVMFLGRMTSLKGGDLLIGAVDIARRRLGRPIHLVMAGDGPRRQRMGGARGPLARDSARFPAGSHGDARQAWLARASVAALPSTWPEPFGLVGLEAAAARRAHRRVRCRRHLASGCGTTSTAWPSPARRRPRRLAKRWRAFSATTRRLAALRAGARRLADEMPLGAHLDRLEDDLQRAFHARSWRCPECWSG